MAYSEKERKTEKGRDQKSRNSASFEQPSFGMPNSLMADILDGGDGGSSVIQRQMIMPPGQIPSAEDEADRLSAGVRGTSPDSVRREMGNRLDADFSSIRFHSDHSSETRAAQMGARAWTSGRDVYFGKGGFEPRVAAHELVHTVQQ